MQRMLQQNSRTEQSLYTCIHTHYNIFLAFTPGAPGSIISDPVWLPGAFFIVAAEYYSEGISVFTTTDGFLLPHKAFRDCDTYCSVTCRGVSGKKYWEKLYIII